MTDRLLGVVLCGGRSSRMGRDKATLPHPSGGTFATHAVDRLASVCDQVCLSGGTVAAMNGVENTEMIPDPVPHRGPVVGVVAALTFAIKESFDACMITAVDMPELTIDDLTRLRKAWEADGKLCCCVSQADDRLQPLVAIYPASSLAALQAVADSEDRSLSRWMLGQNPVRVTITAAASHNINTRQDLGEGG